MSRSTYKSWDPPLGGTRKVTLVATLDEMTMRRAIKAARPMRERATRALERHFAEKRRAANVKALVARAA